MSQPTTQEKAGKMHDSEPVDTEFDTAANDCDLARIAVAWPNLPGPIRRAMLAQAQLRKL